MKEKMKKFLVFMLVVSMLLGTALETETSFMPEKLMAKEVSKPATVKIGDLSYQVTREFSLAVGKKAQFKFNTACLGTDVFDVTVNSMTTSNSEIATISSTGTVVALKEGKTKIKVNYTYSKNVVVQPEFPEINSENKDNDSDNNTESEQIGNTESETPTETEPITEVVTSSGTYEFMVYVTNPTIKNNLIAINIYDLTKSNGVYPNNKLIQFTGTNKYSTIAIQKVADFKFVSSGSGIFAYPKKTGTYKVFFVVDGKKLSCKVKVSDVYFKHNSKSLVNYDKTTWEDNVTIIGMYVGEKTTLSARGFAKSANIKWTSSNKKVATISSKGVLKAKGQGKATITVTDGIFTIRYRVAVSYKRAINAIRYAVKHYNSIYSQPKRMQKGYFDCSSYVWKSYLAAGMNIGKAKNWAPTAASLAQWCKKNHYIFFEGTVKVSKLKPGDLIFWMGAKNKRYKGIYHVDLYQGYNTAITVHRQKVWGETISNVMVARPSKRK